MRGFSAGALLVALVFLAGCGGGGGGGGSTQASAEASKPGKQVVADAVKAADAASSVHMAGQIADSGKQVGIDMTIVRGKGANGSLTLAGDKVDLIVIGDTAYMRAGPTFWKKYGGPAGVGQLLSNKWLKFDTTNPQFGGLTNLTKQKTLFKQLSSTNGTVVNHGATTYNGQNVVAVFDSPENGTLYVASSGTPYPVAIVKKSTSSTGGKVTFDNWNQSVTLTAPQGALDFSKLGSG
jgi:hypothetical protein